MFSRFANICGYSIRRDRAGSAFVVMRYGFLNKPCLYFFNTMSLFINDCSNLPNYSTDSKAIFHDKQDWRYRSLQIGLY